MDITEEEIVKIIKELDKSSLPSNFSFYYPPKDCFVNVDLNTNEIIVIELDEEDCYEKAKEAKV